MRSLDLSAYDISCELVRLAYSDIKAETNVQMVLQDPKESAGTLLQQIGFHKVGPSWVCCAGEVPFDRCMALLPEGRIVVDAPVRTLNVHVSTVDN